MPIDIATKKAIMQLWDLAEPNEHKYNRMKLKNEIDKLSNKEHVKNEKQSTDKFLAHVKLLEEQNIIRRVQTYAAEDVRVTAEVYSAQKNAKLDALEEICGITMNAFLDPSRQHDNPMFDVPPLTTYGFANQLGYEHQVNSVWKM